MKLRNMVAKHNRTYNKSKVFRDRKKDQKRGYNLKHKKATKQWPFYWIMQLQANSITSSFK